MLIKYLLLLAFLAVALYVTFLDVYPFFEAATDHSFKKKIVLAIGMSVVVLIVWWFLSPDL
jgi:hypothetical protein